MPGQQPARFRLANERRHASASDRRRQAMELFKAGASFADIGRTIGVTRQSAAKLVRRELQALAAETRSIAEEALPLSLERLNVGIRQSWGVMMMNCRTCGGNGDSQEGGICVACDGTGRHYHVDHRLKALREMRQCVDQQARMLGLYAPEKLAFTDVDGNSVDFSEELRSLSGDDLDQALADYEAGVEAGRQLEAVKEPDADPELHNDDLFDNG